MILPLNLRTLVAVSVILAAFFVFLGLRESKKKSGYDKVTGKITYFDKELGSLPTRNVGKYRYLIIEGYPYPFEIFVGKESGDFKPEYEQVDSLILGETITAFIMTLTTC